jgi:hypothetical protein
MLKEVAKEVKGEQQKITEEVEKFVTYSKQQAELFSNAQQAIDNKLGRLLNLTTQFPLEADGSQTLGPSNLDQVDRLSLKRSRTYGEDFGTC